MSERITVLHLRASNFVGGPEKQILEHCARLDNATFRPLLCTFVDGDTDPLGAAGRGAGLECRSLQALSPFHPATIRSLVRMIREDRVDIVCSHGYKPNILGTVAARLAGASCIAVSRGWTYESRKIKCYEALDRLFLRYVDHVVAVSEGQKSKILCAGVNPGRVSVIHNAINLAASTATSSVDFRREIGIPQDAVVVASAGRLSPEKNHLGMVEAARMALAKDDRLFFIVFGEGSLRGQLEERIRRSGMDRRFLLPGFRPDLLSLLPAIDIFMLPSFTEGLPNVVLEAYAAGKPVVATAVGGTPEVVRHEVSGYLTQPEAADAMAQYLVTLAGNTGLRKEMGEAGWRHVHDNFCFDNQTRKYEQLYEAIYYRRHAGTERGTVHCRHS